MINLTYDYYMNGTTTHSHPAWVRSERYDFCENFCHLFSFFGKHK